LHGGIRDCGYSIEWHDFTPGEPFDWSRSFHPSGVEICLNLEGEAEVQAGRQTLALRPGTAGFYGQTRSRLKGSRRPGERHRFVTIEYSIPFLRSVLPADGRGIHPRLGPLLARTDRPWAAVSEPARLTTEQQQHWVQTLQRPPLTGEAQRLWSQAKALEIAAALLYAPSEDAELFCHRQQRLNRDRVRRVMEILSQDLVEPPSLEELGRRVGCSHFHLTRMFTREAGKTISAWLRDLRMERAAALLREGRLNVTEVAMAVGYSSPSHFSTAFHETFGCCPGLYPMPGPAPRAPR
jgi:AraC-like DNA-binding protein